MGFKASVTFTTAICVFLGIAALETERGVTPASDPYACEVCFKHSDFIPHTEMVHHTLLRPAEPVTQSLDK
ncbi:hypothetical protein J437_LFUL001512 [Ladona fulva]|uniref:C2H2-type domain-containing protein n=1 Tax=Ladona fulva TaxID=123851 RepID=A0A8K0NVS6_LADFU|nr:hypothetical protein J437_LFUL001512 [Ladona fulva]